MKSIFKLIGVMKSQVSLLFFGLIFSAASQSANLHLECSSQKTIGDWKRDYTSKKFHRVGHCKNGEDFPLAFITINLDTDAMYAEIGEDRCMGDMFSVHISWMQRATVEALPGVYRLVTPNPYHNSSSMFRYDLTRTSSPQVTMLRQGWVFNCEMTEVERKESAF